MTFSTLDPGVMANPYAAYAGLRDGPPIFWSEPEAAWVVHRHEPIAAVLADPAFIVPEVARLVGELSERAGKRTDDLQAFISAVLLLRNPPEHTEGRQYLAAALTAKSLSSYGPVIGEIVRGLLAAAPLGEIWDAAVGFADEVPRRFMGRLLGLTNEEAAKLAGAAMEVTEAFDRGRSMRFYQRIDHRVVEARGVLDAAIALRRREPRDDGLSRMIALSDERFHLDDRDIASRAMFVLFAGVETTSALIGSALATVLDEPAVAERLRREPGLVEAAVEETLRLDAPVQQLSRVARADATVAGQPVKAGERLVLLLGAGNRDAAVHPQPDRFLLDRPARRLLSFGGGIHFCLGASLTRLEVQIALREVIRHNPRAAGPRQWWPHRTLRRMTSLPVVLEPVHA